MKILSIVFVLFAASFSALGQSASPMQQAHREFEGGHYSDAAKSFRAVVGVDPDNLEALAGLVDSLEAAGEWRSAMEPLRRLVALQPNNARRVGQLGLWLSWQGGDIHAALESLGHACSLDKANPQTCTEYADVLAWRSASREQAVTQLRAVLASFPNYVPAMKRLAEVLSWNTNTRSEALKIYEAAVKLDPDNSALLISYADTLAYEHGQRKLAMSMYERALRADPKNIHGMTGEAQVLAWTGHSSDAMQMYDTVLSTEPDNVDALRGKAEILNWRGEHRQALELLDRAHRSAPDNARVSTEMARAEIGLQHYGDAMQIVSALPPAEEYRNLREDASRALGAWTENGASFRRNGDNLNYDRLYVSASTPVGSSNRLTFLYTPTLYSEYGDTFNSNIYAFKLESRLNDRLSITTRGSGESYPGIPPEIDGGIQLSYRVNRAIEIQAGANRSPVNDTLLSLRGAQSVNGFSGQVASNLGNVTARYNNARHGYDGSLSYSDGAYTGRNLDSNRRWLTEGNFGKSLGGAPYFRIEYGFSYASFQYDAEAPGAPFHRFGNYFSPQRYLLNYGGLTVSHKFNDRIQFEATGTAGVQNVEDSTSSFGNAQFASTFSGRLLWRPGAYDEIRIQYDYLDAFNAFHRHLPSITWRHYFQKKVVQ
jgi:tetratricopeptide (TPR) repeat protein